MSRFRFTLDKVRIDPMSHIRMVKHAKENAHFKAFGLLYGALYDDAAEVTAVVPFPVNKPVLVEEDNKDQANNTAPLVQDRKEEDDGDNAKRKYEDASVKFNLDEFKLGRYVVSYRKDFWSEIKNTRIMESKERTSFLLVLDYSLLQTGGNPYRAYRLKMEYSEKPLYSWGDISHFDFVNDNPFVEIPVQVTKTNLFQAMVQFNKQELIEEMQKETSEDNFLQSEIDNFKIVIGNQIERLGVETEIFIHSKDASKDRGTLTPDQYNEFLNKSSAVYNYTQDFIRYGDNVTETQALFECLQE